MKNIIRTVVLLLCVTTLLSACKRPDTDVEVGGKGGNATLKVTPQHHGVNIDSCTIHIKYNVQEKPSTNNDYDEKVVCVMENGKPVATFSNLKKGKYYIYGEGWDPGIDQGVIGGIPYTITEEKTYDITVPVTEGD